MLDASAPDASYFKELDPEAILPGEGTSIEFPTHIFPINANPRRAVDGLGPLDWFLQLNKWSPKTIVIDQGPNLFPASGMPHVVEKPRFAARNRLLTQLVRERGGRASFILLPGDLSVLDELLFVPARAGEPDAPIDSDAMVDFILPAPWDAVRTLTSQTDDARFARQGEGFNVAPGIFRMEE